jgi:acyl-CoA synthetase (AMP-forming)/AMP-acid ligase II
MNNWLLEKFKKFNTKPALTGSWGKFTYAELVQLIEKIESEFSALAGKNSTTIGLISEGCPAGVAWMIAAERLHHWVVPLADHAQETAEKLNQIHAQWVVITDGLTWKIYPRAATGELGRDDKMIAAQHAGLVLFSSGTSGNPKSMLQDLSNLISTYEARRENSLTVLSLLGFDHIGGINTLLGSLASGSQIVIPEGRAPEQVIDVIKKHDVAILPATPTFLGLLLLASSHRLADLASLRLITYGTEPMPDALLARLRQALPSVRLIQTFGTSETGIFKTESPDADSNFLRINDPNVEWKIVEDELWLRSRTQIRGYLNASNDKFTNDGWFMTGDKVEVGPNNTIRILGRTGEMINVGGEKLMPTEVESVILSVPGVVDCRVFGERNAMVGQTVVADVVPQDAKNWEALRTLIRQTCRQSLSAYKVPTRLNLVTAISTNRLKKQRTS